MAVRSGHKEELDELEKRLEELRRRFDLYFQGSPEQRMPPVANQAKFGGELRRIREEEIRTWNTQDKFRFNQVFARFVSMDRMWARTMQQIEDGTYKRDKFKIAQMKKKDVAEPSVTAQRPRPADSLDGLDVDVGSFDDEPIASNPSGPVARAPQPVAMSQAPRAQPARPASANGGGMSDERVKQLYDVYMQAKRRTGETSSLTLDALKKQIEKQIPAIKAKHKCDTVDFKVVLKDGKAMLKAVPK